MSPTKQRSSSNRLGVAVVVVLALASAGVASNRHGPQEHGLAFEAKAPAYLALADSYPFGSHCVDGVCGLPDNIEIQDVPTGNWFVGYPVYLQHIIDRPLVNAACSGETTTSFLSMENPLEGQVCQGIKGAGLLHVDYTASQMQFAETYLVAHPRTVLVTLQLGGPETNAFLKGCKFVPSCILGGLAAHTAGLAARLETILSRIRETYSGQLIFVEYPTTNYNNNLNVMVMSQIYDAVRPVILKYGGQMAPVFDGFKIAAEPFNGNSCAAGLLITTATGACNIHPTDAGHQLIASIIAEMVPAQ